MALQREHGAGDQLRYQPPTLNNCGIGCYTGTVSRAGTCKLDSGTTFNTGSNHGRQSQLLASPTLTNKSHIAVPDNCITDRMIPLSASHIVSSITAPAVATSYTPNSERRSNYLAVRPTTTIENFFSEGFTLGLTAQWFPQRNSCITWYCDTVKSRNKNATFRTWFWS